MLRVAMLALLALPAAAQPAPRLSADGGDITIGADRTLTVQLSLTKSRRINLPVDVRDVIVADPAVADVLVKTPRIAYLIGSKIGDTNAIFLDARGRQVARMEIRVERDLAAMRRAIAELVPNADVQVSALNDDVVISGDVPNSQVAENVRTVARRFVPKDENLVSMIKVTGMQQVLIRVKVAEVRRRVTKKLGMNLFFQGKDFSFGVGAKTGTNLFSDSFGLASSVGAGSYGYGGSPQVGNSTLPWVASGPANLTANSWFAQNLASIEALEEDGLVKVLAEPNLTAVSGEPATFLAGGEFPVPAGQDTMGRIIIEFKPYGVSLAFTPVVLANGRISMRISTEVSEITTEGAIVLASISVPGLTVRRAQTTVEIPSGGSLVLGGLLRNDSKNTIRGLPGLKDLPVLGAMFRSDDFLRNETELMVIATPYIVRPAPPEGMTLPTDGFAAADDLDMYLLNGLYSRYGGERNPLPGVRRTGPATAHDRPAGYIIR
jgi:pilus assembly protein CpaC